MTHSPQATTLIQALFEILQAHRHLYSQQRTFDRVVMLVLAEVFTFGKHTITQLVMTLGWVDGDLSSWYRLFSRGRFKPIESWLVVMGEVLSHIRPDEVLVVAGDATQTPRSSHQLEGTGWLRNLRTPPFRLGIHRAQRWFHGACLLPAENGWTRAIPLLWLPIFTAKSPRQEMIACKEWQGALAFLTTLREQLTALGRASQQVLMVGDGRYDTLKLWQHLPDGVILLARTARNRVLYGLPGADAHRNRKYGERWASPQAIWGDAKTQWQSLTLSVRGLDRHLQYVVQGPVIRYGAPEQVLMLIVVRGKHRQRNGRRYRREPLAFLVNAVQNADGAWQLPLPVETLLFWAWQRWEIEVAHRELKTNFGLGHKQCFHPRAAVASVQWSAWVYALLVLAAYRCWGICGGPSSPTRWWRGSQRWSFNTLWRAYRAELWQQANFHPLSPPLPGDWGEKSWLLHAMHNAIVAAART